MLAPMMIPPNFGWSNSFLVVSTDKEQALLTIYRRQADVLQEQKRIRLAGLAPEKTYVIPERNIRATGATLMQVGIVADLPWGDFASVRYTLIAE
jgi:alpha-galactosidase